MTTLTYTGTLVVTSCWCGIKMAIPDDLWKQAKDKGAGVYCPLGHSWVVKETRADTLQRELQYERDARRYAEDEAARQKRQASAARGQVTKLRKRAIAGACPFGCRRHFADLERHVASKHPGAELEGES